MRPLIAAALAAAPTGWGGPAGAAGDLHLPGGRVDGRRLPRPGGRGRGGVLPGLGDPAARAAQSPLGHASVVGWPCCGGWSATTSCRAEDHRRAGPQRAAAAGEGTRPHGPGAPGGRGATSPIDDLAQALVGAAYVRVDMVERRGEFAVRGGIVDIFPPTEEHPVRIDFFGDTVEEIRYFTVADQRSSELTLTEVIASPCRELLLTDEVRQRAFTLSQAHPELIDMLDQIAQGHAVDGMEALSPVLVDGMELLVDVLPSDTHVLVCDPELVRGRAIDLVKTSEEFLHASWAAAAGGGQAPIDLGASSYQPLADVRAAALARGLAWWTLSPFSAGPGSDDTVIRTDDGEIVDFSAVVATGGVGVADDRRARAGHLPGRGRGRGHRDRPTAGRRLAGRAHRRGQGHDRPDGARC